MAPIRLGMIRADTHAYYYGAMLDRCNPTLLQKHNYVVHHYMSDIYDPQRLTMPFVAGFEMTHVYDDDADAARRFSATFHDRPQVCKSVAQMADADIDAVFIADCNFGGQDHLELAAPFLTRGLPTFVDKPFAYTVADAREIVRLAQKYDAPLFSASILTYVPTALQFKQRFAEITTAYWPLPQSVGGAAPVGLGVVKGLGGAVSQELIVGAEAGGLEDRMAYIIHGVSLALALFGYDVEWVEVMGVLPLEYFHLHMASGCEVMIVNGSIDVFPETCSFFASAYSKFGALHTGPIGDPEFLGGAADIVRLFKQMIETRRPPAAYDDLILPIAVIEAGQKAHTTGGRVHVKEVLEA